ncbi:MAG: PAS domain S-box protein, partial [Candidatus Omnitrophica bacterium]|nr:PAS domain S-box protein [Candidatus Omnitrophota bacterium]
EIIKLQTALSQFQEQEKVYRRLSEELRIVELQQEAILNNIPDIAWLKDKGSRFISVNDAFGKACGVNPKDLTGKTDLDIWPLHLAERYRRDDRAVMESGKRKRVEEPLTDKEEKIKWIETIKTPIYNDQKEIVGTTGIARDITERKQTEERLRQAHAELSLRVKVRTAELSKLNEELHNEIIERRCIEEMLRESESRYRAIVQDQTELICRFLPSGEITFVNDAYCRCFGKAAEELVGTSFMPFIPETDKSRVIENIEKLKTEHKEFTHEHRVVGHDHNVYWQQWTNRPILNDNGELVEIQAVGRDVSELKHTVEALREGERFLSNVFSSIKDGISILDKDLNIIRVNSEMEQWYAHAMPLVGKKCFQAYHSHHSPCTICPTKHTLTNGKSANEIVPRRGPGGKITGWIDLHSFPLIDSETGKMWGVIEYVRDITEKLSVEHKLENVNKELHKTNKRLKQLSLKDALTGLYNHRYLEEVMEAEFYRARRYAHSLAVILVDIDYFKSINEVYGIAFGDLVLKQFAKELKRMLRKYDIVSRFGGEEFVVVSSGTDRMQTFLLAQRLLDALNLFNFGNKKHNVKLKLSISVVAYPEDKVATGMELIKLADRILDKAKERGGNRVYSFEDVMQRKAPAGKQILERQDVKTLKAKIHKLTKRANEGLVESILAFAKTIELKDRYTGSHVENTVHYATEIARELVLGKEEIELIKQASMLHDLGKIGISEKILLKKGKLTSKEFGEIKKHPQVGADIIRPIKYLNGLIPYIFYHHERWDGKGYPTGTRGEEIPLGARIIALADVYQALISDRPYRKAYAKPKAIQIIKHGSGTQFDPHIVDVFLRILQREE